MTDDAQSSPGKATEPKKSVGLTTWILISLAAGIVFGIACSAIAPDGSPVDQYLVEGVFYVLGQWFIRLMQMLVVPLVFCSIVCGAASMSDPKMLGKVGISSILMYLCTTALAVAIAIVLAQLTSPGLGLDMASVVTVEPSATTTDQTMADTLINIIPTNIVAAMNNGTMLQIIFFALVLGFILGRLGKKVATVNRFFTQFNAVMMHMIGLVLKVAPVGIFCLIARTFANLGLTGILPMVKFIGTVYLGLLDMGRTAINVTGDAVVTTCMAKLNGMLDAGVFRNRDYTAISEADLAGAGTETDEPAGYDDFTAQGDPTEIGEQGAPDKFADIDEPESKA